MLHVLRRYIKPDGMLVYSLFVNEPTEGGHGFIDEILPNIAASLTEEDLQREPPDFIDWVPHKPLWRAVYSRRHALELVEGTGWQVESLNEPEEHIQHYIIARPG
ncbi:MAG: hypothetical protein U5K56_08230 [Halioglobus sp.]|nr:hypothetical protein [Halioglobus sp.]